MVTVRNVKVLCQVVKPIQSTFNVHLWARLMRIPSLTHSWLAGGSSGGGSPEPQKLSKPTRSMPIHAAERPSDSKGCGMLQAT